MLLAWAAAVLAGGWLLSLGVPHALSAPPVVLSTAAAGLAAAYFAAHRSHRMWPRHAARYAVLALACALLLSRWHGDGAALAADAPPVLKDQPRADSAPRADAPPAPANAKGDAGADLVSVGDPALRSDFPIRNLAALYYADLSELYNGTRRKDFPAVRKLPNADRLRILVTGGAGFVGSHLVDRLMMMGHEVVVLDNFFTGRKSNIEHWIGHPNFELVRHDVVDPFMVEVDRVYHLACPASPVHYQYNPIKTVKTSVMGSINMLGLCKRVKARFLLTSTSEVYGDPLEHPQKETYWGHVNPIGPRACYDEGKRVAETLTYSYAKQDKVDVRVARIFNTFGPRMNENDGRVVSNFILQALRGEDITVYGDGSNTRSFQYVHDLVDGLIALMESNYTEPVNLGNPDEYTILHFAETIRDIVNPKTKIVHLPETQDDPKQRKPDITRARQQLRWQPKFTVRQGIMDTVEYFRIQHQAGLI